MGRSGLSLNARKDQVDRCMAADLAARHFLKGDIKWIMMSYSQKLEHDGIASYTSPAV